MPVGNDRTGTRGRNEGISGNNEKGGCVIFLYVHDSVICSKLFN